MQDISGFRCASSALAVVAWLAAAVPVAAQTISPSPGAQQRTLREIAQRAVEDATPNPAARSEVGSPKPKIVFEGGRKDGVATVFIGRRGFEKSFDLKFTGKVSGSAVDKLATWDGLPAGATVEVGGQRVFWNPKYDAARMDAACRAVFRDDLDAGYAANAGGPYIGLTGQPIRLTAEIPAALLLRNPQYKWELPDGSQAFTQSVDVTLPKPGIAQAKLTVTAGDIVVPSSALIVAGTAIRQPAVVPIDDLATPPNGYLTYSINARFQVPGTARQVGTFQWDRGDQRPPVKDVDLPDAPYAAATVGDRQVARRYRVAVGYLDQNGNAAAGSHVITVGPQCTVMNVQHHARARQLAVEAIDWGVPFFLGARASAGVGSFAYVDAEEKKAEEEMTSRSFKLTSALMFNPDVFLRMNFTAKWAPDPGDAFDTCLPRDGTTTVVVCEDLFEDRPEMKTTKILELSLQRALSANLAIQPRIARNFSKKIWLVAFPTYFVQNADKALTGGVEFAWQSDKNGISAFVFIGALLDFGQ